MSAIDPQSTTFSSVRLADGRLSVMYESGSTTIFDADLVDESDMSIVASMIDVSEPWRLLHPDSEVPAEHSASFFGQQAFITPFAHPEDEDDHGTNAVFYRYSNAHWQEIARIYWHEEGITVRLVEGWDSLPVPAAFLLGSCLSHERVAAMVTHNGGSDVE